MPLELLASGCCWKNKEIAFPALNWDTHKKGFLLKLTYTIPHRISWCSMSLPSALSHHFYHCQIFFQRLFLERKQRSNSETERKDDREQLILTARTG